jgi:hypothetical protein
MLNRASYSMTDVHPTSPLLLLEALAWLAAARALLAFVPFEHLSPRLGPAFAPAPAQPLPVLQHIRAQEISRAISRAGALAPFQTLCLPRAFAARCMLRWRGIPSRLHIGAMRPSSAKRALTHAWVDCGEVEVTGYPAALNFVELGFFAGYVNRPDAASASQTITSPSIAVDHLPPQQPPCSRPQSPPARLHATIDASSGSTTTA